MEIYVSQEEAISRRAVEEGIDMTTLNKLFESKIEEVTRRHPGQASDWRLGRAEYLLWEQLCESWNLGNWTSQAEYAHLVPGEMFPGMMEKAQITSPRTLTAMLASNNPEGPFPPGPGPSKIYQLSHGSSPASPWIYDRYVLQKQCVLVCRPGRRS